MVFGLFPKGVCALASCKWMPAVHHAVHDFIVTEPYSLVEVNLVFGLGSN